MGQQQLPSPAVERVGQRQQAAGQGDVRRPQGSEADRQLAAAGQRHQQADQAVLTAA